MNAERKIDPEKIHMLRIKTLKGRIANDAEIDSSIIASYRFTNDIATAINEEEKIVGLKLTVYIDTLDNKKEKLDIQASYTHEFVFKVDNLSDFVYSEEEKETAGNDNIVDPLLIGTLAGISYSTTRGIIITRTQGTALNAVILPVIDPKKLMGLTVDEEKK